MSLSIYDDALGKKLKKLFPNVVGASTDEAFSASEDKGKVKLPLISFYRISNPIDTQTYNMPEAFRGRVLKRSEFDGDVGMTLPVLITYQIDIWATSRRICDEIFTELVFYLIRNPNIQISVPKQSSPQDFAMVLQDTENSTELSEFDTIGRIYRSTLTYEVSGKLFYNKSKPVPLVREFDINIKD